MGSSILVVSFRNRAPPNTRSLSLFLLVPFPRSPRGNIRASQRAVARVGERDTLVSYGASIDSTMSRAGLDIPPEQFPPKWNFDRVIIVLGGLETISIGLLKSGQPTLWVSRERETMGERMGGESERVMRWVI